VVLWKYWRFCGEKSGLGSVMGIALAELPVISMRCAMTELMTEPYGLA
jgi:hypothetical protein